MGRALRSAAQIGAALALTLAAIACGTMFARADGETGKLPQGAAVKSSLKPSPPPARVILPALWEPATTARSATARSDATERK